MSLSFLDDFTISGKHINIWDDRNKHLKGWSAKLDWRSPLEGLRFNFGVADSPESDNGETVNTANRSLGFVLYINPDTSLYTSYSRDDRDDSFVRKSIATSLVFKF